MRRSTRRCCSALFFAVESKRLAKRPMGAWRVALLCRSLRIVSMPCLALSLATRTASCCQGAGRVALRRNSTPRPSTLCISVEPCDSARALDQDAGRVSMRNLAVPCSALHRPALRCPSAHFGEPCDSPIDLIEADWRVSMPCISLRFCAVRRDAMGGNPLLCDLNLNHFQGSGLRQRSQHLAVRGRQLQ